MVLATHVVDRSRTHMLCNPPLFPKPDLGTKFFRVFLEILKMNLRISSKYCWSFCHSFANFCWNFRGLKSSGTFHCARISVFVQFSQIYFIASPSPSQRIILIISNCLVQSLVKKYRAMIKATSLVSTSTYFQFKLPRNPLRSMFTHLFSNEVNSQGMTKP